MVATRCEDKAPVFFVTGKIGVAVRASSAVRNIISPIGIQGAEYEDAAEFLIHPDLDYAASPNRSYFTKAQSLGEQATRRVLADLKRTLEQAKQTTRWAALAFSRR